MYQTLNYMHMSGESSCSDLCNSFYKSIYSEEMISAD